MKSKMFGSIFSILFYTLTCSYMYFCVCLCRHDIRCEQWGEINRFCQFIHISIYMVYGNICINNNNTSPCFRMQSIEKLNYKHSHSNCIRLYSKHFISAYNLKSFSIFPHPHTASPIPHTYTDCNWRTGTNIQFRVL